MEPTRGRCTAHPVMLTLAALLVSLSTACGGGAAGIPDEDDLPVDPDQVVPEGFEDACSSSADPAVHAIATAMGYCDGGGRPPEVDNGLLCDDDDGDGTCDDCIDINGDAFCDDCTDYDGDGACDPCLSLDFDGFCDCFDYDDNGVCDDDLNNDCFNDDPFQPCEPPPPPPPICEQDVDYDGICDDEDTCIDRDWDAVCDEADPCVDANYDGVCEEVDCYDFDGDGDCDPLSGGCDDLDGDGVCFDSPGPSMDVPLQFSYDLLEPGDCVDQGVAANEVGIIYQDNVIYRTDGQPRLQYGWLSTFSAEITRLDYDDEGRPLRTLVDSNHDGYADREQAWTYDNQQRLVQRRVQAFSGTAVPDDDLTETWTYEYLPGQTEPYREAYRWRYGVQSSFASVVTTFDDGATIITAHDYEDDGVADRIETNTWSPEGDVHTRTVDNGGDGVVDEVEVETFHPSGLLIDRTHDADGDGVVDARNVVHVAEGAFGMESAVYDYEDDGTVERTDTYLYDADGVLTDRLEAWTNGELRHHSYDEEGRLLGLLVDDHADGSWGHALTRTWHEGDQLATTRNEWDEGEDGTIDAWDEVTYDAQGRTTAQLSGTQPEIVNSQVTMTYDRLCLSPSPQPVP